MERPAQDWRDRRVPGRVEGGVVETADVFTTPWHDLVRANGYQPHIERFERAGLHLAHLLRPASS